MQDWSNISIAGYFLWWSRSWLTFFQGNFSVQYGMVAIPLDDHLQMTDHPGISLGDMCRGPWNTLRADKVPIGGWKQKSSKHRQQGRICRIHINETHLCRNIFPQDIRTALRTHTRKTVCNRRVHAHCLVETCKHVGQLVNRDQVDLLLALKHSTHFLFQLLVGSRIREEEVCSSTQ